MTEIEVRRMVRDLKGNPQLDPICDDDPFGLMPEGYEERALYSFCVDFEGTVTGWALRPPGSEHARIGDAIHIRVLKNEPVYVLMPPSWWAAAVVHLGGGRKTIVSLQRVEATP